MYENGPSPEVETFLKGLHSEFRDLVFTMREAVLAACPDLEEAIKWRRLTFTRDGDWHHWVCAIGASTSAVALHFHKGVLLDDPAGVLSGDAKYTRMISGEDVQDIDGDVFTALMEDAVSKQTEMLGD